MTDSAASRAGGDRGGRRAARRSRVVGLVVGLVGIGLATSTALWNVASALPALLYVVVVCFAALIGGTGVGLATTVASFLAFSYFFIPPRRSFDAPDTTHAVALVVFAGVAVGMSQLVVRERRLREREAEARRLAENAGARTLRLEAVARALAGSRTPQQVLDAILTEGLAAAEARAGLIGMVTPDGKAIEVVAERGYEDGRFERWGRFAVEEQLPLSEAVRSGEPVYLSSTAERDQRFPLLAGLTDASHALTCLPLVFEGRTLGGLVLSFPSDQDFDAERRALEEALAAQAAQALDRARLDEAERELRDRLAFLAEASELLASSLDYEQTLRQLADLAVPRLADWCSVDMVAEDGSVQRLAVAHQDPAKVRYALELAERYPPDPQATTGVPNVLRTGEPEFMPEITDELLVAAVEGDEDLLRILRELGLRSAMTLPLVARGTTLGALTLIAAETVRPYTQTDLRLAEDLARRAAVAVDNARLHAQVERRADAARALRHVADAVVLVDHARRPRYWNDAARRLFGEEAGALAGWEIVEPLLAEPWARDGPQATFPVELDAGERWLQVSRSDFEGGCVYALRDVTEERLLERTRSEFVATASHELRTPIAAVYGAFQTLLREDVTLGPDRQLQFLRIGLGESERLTRIVDDLLLVGQLDGGTPKIERKRCDLSELIGDVVEVTTATDDHRLVAAVEPMLKAVECDPMRLRQVLLNLVENAVKYSPDGGTITVSAGRANGNLRIEVADEGIGIPPFEQARIFERFVRLDPALSRGVGGTGLGLYICRELVGRMGGRISVRSREGQGATFLVELPAA